MHYSISCLVCLPLFRSKGTWWSYVNRFNCTNIYPVLSTAKPNFHSFLPDLVTGRLHWDWNKIHKPFWLFIDSSGSGKVPVHTDYGQGFESSPARTQSSLKRCSIPSSYRNLFFTAWQGHACLTGKFFHQYQENNNIWIDKKKGGGAFSFRLNTRLDITAWVVTAQL